MRSVVIVMLLTFSASAQQGSGALAACGPKGTQFEMKRDESQHTLLQPDPEKAQVYFIQDIGALNCLGSCSSKIAVDGKWVGANQHNSYFSVSVGPGEHHVCVNMGAQFSPHTVALAHFAAEAGRIYYFRVRPFLAQDQLLSIDPVDRDEGQYLITYYPLSVSRLKP